MHTDSLYLLYWRVKKHFIGPVKYYVEEDLVKSLYNLNQIARNSAATMLRDLFQKYKNRICKGCAIEHTTEYWEEKIALLKKGCVFLK